MKRLLSVLCAAVLLFSLNACSTGEPAGSSDMTGKVSKLGPQESAEPQNAAPPEPTAKPVPTPIPENLNLLTGEGTLSKEAYGKRPVSVMINNATASLPQYGIGDADIIFEIPVEGDTTRLMAMYGDYTKVPDLCSIRSCRYYYPMLSEGFDSIYIHWGKDETVARRVLEELKLDNIDGNYGSYGLFDRDQSRLNEGYALEHTGILYGPKIPSALQENGVRTDLKKEKTKPAFSFQSKATPAKGASLTQFRVDFGIKSGYGYYSDFSYDDATKTYLKTHNEKKHIDGKTEEQLSFTNVIILETDVGYLPNDNSGRREIDVTAGKKSGYYLSGGNVQKISWAKKTATDYITLLNEDGKKIKINTGKTYIAVCDEGGLVKQ